MPSVSKPLVSSSSQKPVAASTSSQLLTLKSKVSKDKAKVKAMHDITQKVKKKYSKPPNKPATQKLVRKFPQARKLNKLLVQIISLM